LSAINNSFSLFLFAHLCKVGNKTAIPSPHWILILGGNIDNGWPLQIQEIGYM